MKDLFSGRTMKCQKCGWEFKSREGLNSMWTTVEMDGKLLDYCPFCWGVPKHLIPKELKAARARDFDQN